MVGMVHVEISIDCEGFIMQIYRWARGSGVIVTVFFVYFSLTSLLYFLIHRALGRAGPIFMRMREPLSQESTGNPTPAPHRVNLEKHRGAGVGLSEVQWQKAPSLQRELI